MPGPSSSRNRKKVLVKSQSQEASDWGARSDFRRATFSRLFGPACLCPSFRLISSHFAPLHSLIIQLAFPLSSFYIFSNNIVGFESCVSIKLSWCSVQCPSADHLATTWETSPTNAVSAGLGGGGHSHTAVRRRSELGRGEYALE